MQKGDSVRVQVRGSEWARGTLALVGSQGGLVIELQDPIGIRVPEGLSVHNGLALLCVDGKYFEVLSGIEATVEPYGETKEE